ncbi:MAG: TonB-dependent receptor, partial [Saprospiraceae bacterium]|nr:TonB-dependent receptor [Saprospiraceae bacterium]
TEQESGLLLPRAQVEFDPFTNHKLSLAIGRQAKLPAAFLLLADSGGDLPFILSDQVSLKHQMTLGNKSTIKAEVFGQYHSQVPVPSVKGQGFHGLNFEEAFLQFEGPLEAEGEGRNYGLELAWQQFLRKDLYFFANGTLFKSEFLNEENQWQDSRYDTRYILNATVGKEFNWKKKWPKTFGVNLRFHLNGGQRYTPVDLPSSIIFHTMVLDDANYLALQFPEYWKADLRIYLRTSKTKRSSSLSLDIQNLTNRKNVGWIYYDPDLRSVERKDQLGLIPILNWRLEL